MSLSQFRCERCKLIPETGEVYNCKYNHLICLKCGAELSHICQCLEKLKKTQNQLLLKVQTSVQPCGYASFGCTWKFSKDTMDNHLLECKYRPYECIGSRLNIWQCSWKGMQQDIEDHIKHAHTNYPPFEYFQYATVQFDDKVSVKTVNLVKAFSKNFVFYYSSNIENGLVLFLIYYLGRKEDAEKYLVDFEILASSPDKHRKIKFIVDCYSDADNIQDIIDKEKCVVLTVNVIKNYLDKDKIAFRFIIKRKDDEDKSGKTILKTIDVNSKSEPKSDQFSFKDKGLIKQNNKKSSITSSSSNTTSNSSSSTNKKTTEVPPVPAKQVPTNNLTTDTNNDTNKTADIINKTFSSISFTTEPSTTSTEDSPCYSPSIHRETLFEPELKQTNNVTQNKTVFSRSCSTPNGINNNRNARITIQPYKNSDDYLYRQKYPATCLSKPMIKK